jgi:hypothetical protein
MHNIPRIIRLLGQFKVKSFADSTVCVHVMLYMSNVLSKYRIKISKNTFFSQSMPVSCINKTDRHDITIILLKMALNTIKPNQSKPIRTPTSFVLNVDQQVKTKINLWFVSLDL